jgi:hypothetical protein
MLYRTILSTEDLSLYGKAIPIAKNDFVKTYYDHGLEQDEDGYFAAHITGMFEQDIHIDMTKTTEFWCYFGNPTIENANKLLRSQDYSIPLEYLVDYIKTDRIDVDEVSSKQTATDIFLRLESDEEIYKEMVEYIEGATLYVVIDGYMGLSTTISQFFRRIMLFAWFQSLVFNAWEIQSLCNHLNKDVIQPFKSIIDNIVFVDGRYQQNESFCIAPFVQKLLIELKFNLTNVKRVSVDIDEKALERSSKQEVKDLAIRNFVRDAWKSDIAVMNHALFVTGDRNAFIYYKYLKTLVHTSSIGYAMFVPDDMFKNTKHVPKRSMQILS